MPGDDDVRAALETAMTAAEVPEPATEPSALAGEPANDAAPPPAANDDAEQPETDAAEAKPERARAADGKFASKAAVSALKPTAVAQAPGTVPAPLGQTPEVLRAPQGWKPSAREAFSKAPREVQEEAIRREHEVARVLTESASARRLADSVREALSPYSQILGADPIRGAAGIVQTAHALANAPPAHKAQIIANLIKGYNVPIEALADAIDGKGPGAGQQYAQPAQDVSQLVRQEFQRMQSEAQRAQGKHAVEEFAQTQPEFFDDVRGQMASLMEGGLAKDLQEAYKIACQLHPEIKGVLAQREQAQQAKAQLASTQRAREAASSVRSQPGGQVATPGAPTDWRDALERVASERH